jgi:hypothetical protein
MLRLGRAQWYQRGMSSCPECGLDSLELGDSDLEPIYLDHCHGTLIVHRDHSVECTDQSCELSDLLRHAFVVDCFALGGCCTDQETLDFSAAS